MLTVLREKELRDSSLPTIGRDREGRGHILVLKIKVPARFNQLLRDGSIPNQLRRDGSFCKNEDPWLGKVLERQEIIAFTTKFKTTRFVCVVCFAETH